LIPPHRRHPLWLFFALHRLSGVALALFLPVHFWVLSLALTDPEALDGFLAWSAAGWVKLAEMGLVFLLALHLLGGLRLLVLELLPWRERQKTAAAGAAALAAGIALVFLLNAG
jgi:fumarate reductase subunit D